MSDVTTMPPCNVLNLADYRNSTNDLMGRPISFSFEELGIAIEPEDEWDSDMFYESWHPTGLDRWYYTQLCRFFMCGDAMLMESIEVAREACGLNGSTSVAALFDFYLRQKQQTLLGNNRRSCLDMFSLSLELDQAYSLGQAQYDAMCGGLYQNEECSPFYLVHLPVANQFSMFADWLFGNSGVSDVVTMQISRQDLPVILESSSESHEGKWQKTAFTSNVYIDIDICDADAEQAIITGIFSRPMGENRIEYAAIAEWAGEDFDLVISWQCDNHGNIEQNSLSISHSVAGDIDPVELSEEGCALASKAMAIHHRVLNAKAEGLLIDDCDLDMLSHEEIESYDPDQVPDESKSLVRVSRQKWVGEQK